MMNKMMMFDLETFATSYNAAIVSIGACLFDIEGNVSDLWYSNVSLDSCITAGLEVDPKTVDWWLEQSSEARNALFADPVLPLEEALQKFRSSFPVNKVKGIWSHATFDFVIMNNALDTVGLPRLPYRQARDIRTLSFLTPKMSKNQVKFKGIPHNALDDAIHQCKYVSHMLRRLRENHS